MVVMRRIRATKASGHGKRQQQQQQQGRGRGRRGTAGGRKPSEAAGAVAGAEGTAARDAVTVHRLNDVVEVGGHRGAAGVSMARREAPELLSGDRLSAMEDELFASSASIPALRRFNERLAAVDISSRSSVVGNDRLWSEMCYNLESFNAVFTSVLLKVQLTIGTTDYANRDRALKSLIQPLGGEYGLSTASSGMLMSHRELFQTFYESIHGAGSMPGLLERAGSAPEGESFLRTMLGDIDTCGAYSSPSPPSSTSPAGGGYVGAEEQAAYALGYNLAVEYLASFEKEWLLQSFRALAAKGIIKSDEVDWEFLEIHAEGEKEHASLGHDAVVAMVGERHVPLLRKAMADHDREFAAYYDFLTSLLVPAVGHDAAF